ncbi:MAG: hypothetical protein M1834_003154 [Cirrosporium novae-zelandiae]|nr:MAG: hypothetical protein M1834_003154 [Cirrosporium novae-zelandiae]
MAARSSLSFSSLSTPYNPQEWGPVGVGGPNPGAGPAPSTRHSTQSMRSISATVDNSRAEEGLSSPPPPYSPRRSLPSQPSTAPSSTMISPSDVISPTTNPSQYQTPVTSASIVSSPENVTSHRFRPLRPRPQSLILPSHDVPPGRASPLPPPPPPQNNNSRASSRNTGDRRQSAFNIQNLASRLRDQSQPPAIKQLQQSTVEALASAPRDQLSIPMDRPPASRRAASTGDINTLQGYPAVRDISSRSPSGRAWEPGMPLPPPPPGPPPNARTQSARSTTEDDSTKQFPLAHPIPKSRRSNILGGTRLETVPPTPADWVDEDLGPSNRWLGQRSTPVPVNVQSIPRTRSPLAQSTITNEDGSMERTRSDSSASGLYRSSAIRDPNAKGIRERRTESRHGKERAVEPQESLMEGINSFLRGEDIRPADLDLSYADPKISHRRASTRSNMKSNELLEQGLSSSSTRRSGGNTSNDGSSKSTPRPESSSRSGTRRTPVPTPPFSPEHESFRLSKFPIGPSPTLPPKALPTPPIQHGGEYGPPTLAKIDTGTRERPISHILHTPISETSIQAPLIPSRPQSSRSAHTQESPSQQTENDAFCREAIDRYRNFLKKETSENDDRQRLQVFVDFIIAESRIRRERYGRVFEDTSFDVHELLGDLFELRKKRRPSSNEYKDFSSKNPWSQDLADDKDQMLSATVSSDTSQGQDPNTEPSSPAHSQSIPHSRPESGFWTGYMPSLSPIASLSISTGRDEMDSRGRPPSRWWESSHPGSTSDGNGRRVERTKKETKYMSLCQEIREGWAGEEQGQMSLTRDQGGTNSSFYSTYGPDEYPPEKGGVPEAPSFPAGFVDSPPPFTPETLPPPPEIPKLDVSRLVTLPPPYPRHYPAVNNNHPDLVSIRGVVRTVTNFDEANDIKNQYHAAMASRQEERHRESSSRRNTFRTSIHQRVASGDISFSDAAQAESILLDDEQALERKLAQSDFDAYQSTVITPLYNIFTERIETITSSFNMLCNRLSIDAQQPSSDLTQEEGDEQPELLEKLTLLKWLFEAREQLHRESYDLLSERNSKYQDLVTLPYRQTQNQEKLRDAQAFFASDDMTRKRKFHQDALTRFTSFATTIEENVTRGVEVHLSAFWDIAPPLSELLSKIPDDGTNNSLTNFKILVPPKELGENPSYAQWPLRYLYEVVEHAGKSTYQYVESQINLLCLLHEVQSGLVKSRCELLRLNNDGQAGGSTVGVDVEGVRKREEEKLTRELKEKVVVAEDLWRDGLGEIVERVKGRVRAWLVERGAWVGDEEGVGSL